MQPSGAGCVARAPALGECPNCGRRQRCAAAVCHRHYSSLALGCSRQDDVAGREEASAQGAGRQFTPAAPHVRSVRLLEQGSCQLNNVAVEMGLVEHVAPLCTAIQLGELSAWRCGLRTSADGRLRTCDLGPACARSWSAPASSLAGHGQPDVFLATVDSRGRGHTYTDTCLQASVAAGAASASPRCI